jgi:hypothetical protein
LNPAGHRVIGSIACRQLDEPTRLEVANALKAHPAYADLWAARDTNGPDAALNLFWNASVFPDDERGGEWRKYNRGPAHYVNFRIMAADGNKVEPPLPGENVINSYVAHVRKAKDSKTSAEDRALHVSWIFQQAGDAHQPLHAVARFSKALPTGDRGGNGVTFPNPRGQGGQSNNLHAFWDDLIATDTDPATVERVADELVKEYPRDGFEDELERTNIGDWAEESVAICLKTVYRDLDPEIISFADAPVGYEADGRRVARRRGARAGYRLAEKIKRVFSGD